MAMRRMMQAVPNALHACESGSGASGGPRDDRAADRPRTVPAWPMYPRWPPECHAGTGRHRLAHLPRVCRRTRLDGAGQRGRAGRSRPVRPAARPLVADTVTDTWYRNVTDALRGAWQRGQWANGATRAPA